MRLSCFLLIACATEFAACATPPTATITSGTGVLANTVPLTVFQAAKQPAPLIVLGPGCAGANNYAAGKARELQGWGYNVVLVDSHTGRGRGSVCENNFLITEHDRVRDILAAAEWTSRQPWHAGKIGYFGYSAGGLAGNHLAERDPGKIAAVVNYYPWCNPFDFDPKVPVQIHIGTADDWTPSARCWHPHYREKRDIRYYEGAAHSFDIPEGPRTVAGHRLEYDPGAARRAADAARQFLDRHLR